MYSITRRILPVAAAIAVTATLSAWVTAGAEQSNVRQNAVTVMHFRTVVTSRHLSLNGATEKNLAGAVFTATAKLVARPPDRLGVPCSHLRDSLRPGDRRCFPVLPRQGANGGQRSVDARRIKHGGHHRGGGPFHRRCGDLPRQSEAGDAKVQLAATWLGLVGADRRVAPAGSALI